MSSESIVSRPLHYFDVPEVNSLSADFSYNFFVSDEKVNESGNEAVNGNLSSRLLRKGTADITNLNARIPRYVSLTFTVQDTPKKILATKNSAIRTTRREIQDALDAGNIYTETQAAGLDFDAYVFANDQVPTNLDNFFRRRLTSFGGEESSPLDLLRQLADISKVNSNLLEDMLSPQLKGMDTHGQWLSKERKNYGVAVLNTSYAPAFLRKSCENGSSLRIDDTNYKFCTAVDNLQPDLNKYVSNSEYLFDVPFTDIELTQDSTFVAEADVIGYIFEKVRIYKGKRYPMPSVIVAGASVRTGYDSEIAYGQTYEYSARTIAKFRVPMTDYETGEVFIGTFLLASRPSAVSKTTITENRRPDPPSDINFYFDYDDENVKITWAPPVNPQRDVKYLQIFRRKSVEEPFELLVHYDWDDSIIRTTTEESIDPDLIKTVLSCPTYYIDTEFDKEKTFIYALVTIDARQLSSTYSTQYEVSFDEAKNRIHKGFLSYAGAPKQYPNWFLKENFFVDSIKDSTHKQLTIYFNPETYGLITDGGNEISAFCTTSMDPYSKYVFQLINTDRLDEAQVEVVINDEIYRRSLIPEDGGMLNRPVSTSLSPLWDK